MSISHSAPGPSLRHWVFLIGFLLLLFFFLLGSRGLNEPDEGRYANIAREMLEPEHGWLDPQMSDIGHYDKPPLVYWCTAACFRLFGPNDERTARLPSVFGAILTLIGLGWTAYRLYGSRCAWWSVFFAGTLVHIWIMARTLTPDMLLTGWCALAIGAWAETKHRGGKWNWWLCQLLFWTLAWWTKATPALIPLLGLALYTYLYGDNVSRRALKLPLLLPLILILGSPWFLYMMWKHPELTDFFFHRELAGRITGHADGRHAPLYFYALVSIVAWLPWWPLAFANWITQKKHERAELSAQLLKRGPEALIILVGLVVLTCTSSKLQTYTLILAPWAALLCARVLLFNPKFSVRFLYSIAALAALTYGTLAYLAPSYEASWGRNSSLRPVALFLRAQGAQWVHSDHYWPSLEFYWGEQTCFAGFQPPLELASDRPRAFEHFEETTLRTTGNRNWFVHFAKQPNTIFQKWIDDAAVKKFSVGDFIVGKIPASSAP